MKGELLVEIANGRIWESRLTATVGGTSVELVTNYRFDERLGLMLPTVFRELYEKGKAAQARMQRRKVARARADCVRGEVFEFQAVRGVLANPVSTLPRRSAGMKDAGGSYEVASTQTVFSR